MNIKQLEQAGQLLYGDQWQANLARKLDVDVRRIRHWIAGTRPIPEWLKNEMLDLLKTNQIEINKFIKTTLENEMYTITDKNGRTKSFGTAKQLFTELAERSNGWSEGEGAVIEKNGQQLFHSSDYIRAVNKLNDEYAYEVENGNKYAKKSTISIKKILEVKNNE